MIRKITIRAMEGKGISSRINRAGNAIMIGLQAMPANCIPCQGKSSERNQWMLPVRQMAFVSFGGEGFAGALSVEQYPGRQRHIAVVMEEKRNSQRTRVREKKR
jgi:hypothetical protein